MDTVQSARYAEFSRKKAVLSEQVRAAIAEGVSVGLKKSTSNLFRYRNEQEKKKVDVRSFNQVLSVDVENLVLDVEGMTTYDAITKETLKFGVLPTVVPELKSITIGGAISGVGIESSSFKFGLVHETVLELEVLLADGSVVVARPDNEFRDLFFGFPNSYGTLGYVLRAKVRLVRAKSFVHLSYERFSTPEEFFAATGKTCLVARHDGSLDFIDGVIFDKEEFVLVRARFVDTAPYTSDYTYMKMFFASLKEREEDFLSAYDYIWRWDTDWFWCSKHFGVQNKVVRFFAKPFLRSTAYWKIRSFANKLKLHTFSKQKESVVQDVEIPLQSSIEFSKFLLQDIGVLPIWVCPTMAFDPKVHFDLYPMEPLTLYMNFGFWDVIPTSREDGYYNRLIEKRVAGLQGKKSLYSTSFYTPEEFWKLYNKPSYDRLKQKYDANGRLKNLYEKCVRRG